MLQWISFCIILFAGGRAWSQLGFVLYETPSTSTDDSLMRTQPPLSGESYPTLVGLETRSNFMSVGVHLDTAYDDNVLEGSGYTPIGDIIYSVSPTVTFDQTTVRRHLSLVYSSGYTFYEQARGLDTTSQNASIGFQYRLGEHTNLNLIDSFQKTSNVFDQLYPSNGFSVSGSAQAPPMQVVAPYANFLTNTASVGMSHQISRDAMIGLSGMSIDNQYLNMSQLSEFYNSSLRGGIVFYNRRLSGQHYMGVTYEHMMTLDSPANPQGSSADAEISVQTQAFKIHYTSYLSPTISFSLSGGPQYFDASQQSRPSTSSWTPSIAASVGWRRDHSNVTASYLKTVTGSNGLAGAFDSSKADASWRWQMAKAWTAGLTGIYFEDKNVSPSLSSSVSGGHTISAAFSLQHSLGEHVTAEIGYARLHQSYKGITVLSETPDIDRVNVSISYQLTRPLGR